MDSYDDYLSGLIRGFWDYAEQEFGLDPAVFETVERRGDQSGPAVAGGTTGHGWFSPSQVMLLAAPG